MWEAWLETTAIGGGPVAAHSCSEATHDVQSPTSTKLIFEKSGKAG